MVNVFRGAADIVVVLHAAFAMFVALGAPLAIRWRRVMWVHIPAVAWGALIEFSGWVCPLTPLENALRLRAGEAVYSEDFIARHLLPALYPANLTRTAQLAIGSAALLFNVLMYGCLLRRSRRTE